MPDENILLYLYKSIFYNHSFKAFLLIQEGIHILVMPYYLLIELFLYLQFLLQPGKILQLLNVHHCRNHSSYVQSHAFHAQIIACLMKSFQLLGRQLTKVLEHYSSYRFLGILRFNSQRQRNISFKIIYYLQKSLKVFLGNKIFSLDG